jgi:hypothetical protein
MKESEIVEVLTRFHREVFLPDIQRVLDEAVAKFIGTLHTTFDGMHARCDRLETLGTSTHEKK